MTNRIERDQALEKLGARFSDSIKVSDKQIGKLFQDTQEQIHEYAKVMNINLNESGLVRNILVAQGAEVPVEEQPSTADLTSHQQPDITKDLSVEAVGKFAEAEALEEQKQILANGAKHVKSSLHGRYDLNSLMITVLETMYRGLGLSRVIFCLNDPKTNTMRARSGFGKDIDDIIPQFTFALKSKHDWFNRAMVQGNDIVVTDSTNQKFARWVPDWYQRVIGAPMFLLYPIRINRFPAALFYGDLIKPNRDIDKALFKEMRVLRDQAAEAIRQSHHR